jgi:hypothetical protein
LSGSGSRTVVTAGTADEETFEVKSAGGKGNGVFTRALLAALQEGTSQGSAPAFLAIDQVVAAARLSVAKFAAVNDKTLNPKLWTFADDEYRGSFVFLNPAVRRGPLNPSHLARLKAKPRGEEPPAPEGPDPTSEPTTPPTPPGEKEGQAPPGRWIRLVLAIPAGLQHATVLVDGSPARVLTRLPNFIDIQVPGTDRPVTVRVEGRGRVCEQAVLPTPTSDPVDICPEGH